VNIQITNSRGRELTGIRSENTMKETFVRLARKNLIERVPNTQGRNSSWQLKHANSEPINNDKSDEYKKPIQSKMF
jgi:hypothetical protein